MSIPYRADLASASPAARFSLAALAAGVVVGGAMLWRPGVLDDGDTYWHLAAGEWMLRHAQVLKADVFSFTMPGQPWIAHEWLSEILMAAAARLAGLPGLLVLYAVAAGLAAAETADWVARRMPPLSAALTLALGFGLAAPSLLTRPHVLALPLLALFTVTLLRSREAGTRPPLWLAGVMLAWANLHGSYVFGFLLLAAFGLEALLAAGPARVRVAAAWALTGGACALAALANPNGLEGVLHPLRLMNLSFLNAIDEWKPVDFSRPGLVELAMLATFAVCLWRGVRMPAVRLGLLLLVLHMTLQHHRHQAVLAIVGPLLLAGPIGETLPGRGATGVPKWAAPAMAGLAVLLLGLRLAVPLERTNGPNTPVAALAHVPAALRGQPVLNSYGFGGYLIAQGQPVFIDGRADMYGDAFVRRYLSVRAADPRALDAALAQYGIRWTLLEPGERLVAAMDQRPGWRRLYADRWAVIHVRDVAP